MASLPASVHGDDQGRNERLNEVIAAYLEAVESGAAPDRAQLLAREPELSALLAGFFADEDHLAGIAAEIRRPPVILPYPALQRDESRTVSDASGADSRTVCYFGDYELLDVIAVGGMGIVYRARQVSLNRIIALKMVRAGRLAAASDLMRFRLEAEASARLDHPNIVPIYEVGEHEGHHYFSMKLIDGGNLASESARFRGDSRAAARLMATVARAVHFAHLRGILHRDLKPANILLCESPDDPPGRSIPMVSDFGLARRVDAADSLGPTSSGSIVGTPAYMAPEQAEGRRESVTTAVDIHALGAILYELLTGRPPFRGDSVMETLHQVRHREPARPRSINRGVPRDLETIVLKCLEKQPSERYATAQALAEDLDRWLAGLPIHARAATPLEHMVKWLRRRPAAAALAVLAGAFALAALLAIRGLVSSSRLQSAVADAGMALDTEKQKREDAESQLVEMEDDSYFKQLIAAQDAWEHFDPAGAELLLDRCPVRLRGWEWHHLWRTFHSELQTFKGHNGLLCAVSFTPEGAEGVDIPCATEPRGGMLWDTSSGQVVRRVPGHDGTCYGLAFDRAGTRIACASASGIVRIWDLKTGDSVAQLKGHEGWVSGVAFSPDDSTLASSGQDGTIQIWNVDRRPNGGEPAPRKIFRGHDGPVFGVAFSSDGATLASAGHDGTVRLWNLRQGEPENSRVFRGHHQPVRCVAFHPACTLVASAGADRLVRIWNLATGEEVRHFGEFGNRVDGIAFSPDGTRIATACLDRSVRIWDVETGTEVASFPGHTAPVFSVTFSPDGKKLASASQDATVKIWDLTNLPGVRMLHLPEHGSRSSLPGISWTGGVAFRPGSGELAAAGSDQTLAVWRPHSRTARLEIAPGWGALTSVQYSAEGQLLATAGADRRVRIRDAGSLAETMLLHHDEEGLVSLAFDPTKPILATGGGDPLAVLHQPRGKEVRSEWGPRSIRLWDLKTGTTLRVLSDHRGSIHALLFAFDGSRLFSAGSDGSVRIWDPATGRLLQKLSGHTGVLCALALRRDGRVLASAGEDGTIRIWDPVQGRLVRVLSGHANWICALAFHPDGSRLASAGADRTVRLWDVNGGREVLTLRGHHDRVLGVAFSPDGTCLASASADGDVRIWETEAPTAEPKP